MSIIAQSLTNNSFPIDYSTCISSSSTTATIYLAPEYQHKPQKWTCKYCNCRNKPDHDNCPHCGAPAGDEE